MSDYIKQLEERNEQLEKRLSSALSSLDAIGLFNRKLVYYMYRIDVRKGKGEWQIWQYAQEKHEAFSPFGKFAKSLFEFDKVIIRSIRTARVPLNSFQYEWAHETAWRIDLVKEQNKRGKDTWMIEAYENFAQYKFKEDWKDIRGTTFVSYLQRQHKIRMKQP